MEEFLPVEVIKYIYEIKHKLEMQDLMKEIKIVPLILFKEFNEYSSFGLVFGGANNSYIGERQGYGIFIKEFRYRSTLDHLKNYQIIEINGKNTIYATFNDLKSILRRMICSCCLSLKLRYNPRLIKSYS